MSPALAEARTATSPGARAPFAWEKHYPPGLAWDAPIVLGTVPALLAQSAADHAGRTALEFRDRAISYAELGRAADEMAAAFLRRGLKSQEAVAIYLPNTPMHPVAFFGGLKAGAKIVHLSPLDAERELMHKLRDSGARVLVTTNFAYFLPNACKMLDAGLLDLVIVDEDAAWGPSPIPSLALPDRPDVVAYKAFVADAAAPARWPDIKPDDIALLQYTGGTTGAPKGAILSHANLTAAVAIYDAWFTGNGNALRENDKVITVLPLFHIYALTTVLLLNLKGGAELLLRMRFDVETVLRDIEVKRATVFPGVPTMWIAIANLPGVEKRDFSSLRYCGSGGAPLPVETAKSLHQSTGITLRGGWGMTETSPAGTGLPMNGSAPAGSIGIPLPGIELGVVALDDPHRVLGVGETGELRVKGPNVTRGYWNRPDESAASFADGYFLTGDIGYMDKDGFFFIVDRKKDMIISGGFNVYPQMIEQAIYEHPAVNEVLVIGVPDSYRGESAKAFVSLRAGAEPFTLEELREFLRGKIGPHEMPTSLEFRAALPRTPVGKLSKIELREEARKRG
ncbi:dicarboxylate--CoA ligase PimA [Methylocapsa sp. S129]|uniref:dicarboxylate--CoA ligase PimA n=1 Tax=Methylocapsa sp. S129 TaxID=1641869 RepID=UPI00131BF1E7|nr:dicarboxylate--CoA ligase PimA [Methylocapsa sp. S129]